MRKILPSILLIATFNCYGQAGYIGKMNEVSFDVFNAAFLNQLEFTYKLSPYPNASFYISYGTCNATRKLPIQEMSLHVDDGTGYNSTYLAEGDIASGRMTAKVSTYGFGILYNSPYNNMQMPVGYYSGIGVHVSRGDNTDEYILTSSLPSEYSTSVPYQFKETSLRFICGKNTVITSMITLDLSFGFGISWGSLTRKEGFTQGIVEDQPFSQYPASLPVFHKREFIDFTGGGYGNGTELARYSFLGVYLMPHIRIGYIF